MNLLTKAEASFVSMSCGASNRAFRSPTVALFAVSLVCVGSVLAVAGKLWGPPIPNAAPSDIQKAIGFFVVIAALSWHIWFSERQMRVARSVIAKLCNEKRCARCGHEHKTRGPEKAG
jgi:hypothetical protein